MSDIPWKDQYKHPLWQKKRLEALEYSEYHCERCGDGESQLHVHHKFYIKGRMLWDYDLSYLSVLCESCHEATHLFKDETRHILSRIGAEGVGILTALLYGYCREVWGPCYVDDFDCTAKDESPRNVIVGNIAAKISGLHTEDLIALSKYFDSGNIADILPNEH